MASLPVPTVGNLWRRLTARLRTTPIASVNGFKTFIEERAALISQKCAVDYCRGKTGLASYALFEEQPFLKALDVCRWETFVTVAGDLLIVAEGHLRPHAAVAEQPRLRDALVGIYSAMLEPLAAPAHRPEGWGEVIASFAPRLLAVTIGQPKQALDVADHSAKRLFDTLPIHARYRELDEEVVYGAVRFRMVAVSQEMQRRFAGPELARHLTV